MTIPLGTESPRILNASMRYLEVVHKLDVEIFVNTDSYFSSSYSLGWDAQILLLEVTAP